MSQIPTSVPQVGQDALVRLACEALVQSFPGDGLAVLAGLSVEGTDAGFTEVLAEALGDLGLALPEVGNHEAQVGAVRAQCRRALRGELSPRALVRWVHGQVGHGGPDELQRLVELDDEYDTVEYNIAYGGRTALQLDDEIRREAQSLSAPR